MNAEERQRGKNPSFIFWIWKNRIVHWVGLERRRDALYPLGSIVFCFGWLVGMYLFLAGERFRSIEINFLCCACADGKWSSIHLNYHRILFRSFEALLLFLGIVWVCETRSVDLSIAANECIFSSLCKWFVYFYVNQVEFEFYFRCI